MAEKKLLVGIAEAAQILDISISSVRHLIKRGLLTPKRELRHIKFSVKELERFANAQ